MEQKLGKLIFEGEKRWLSVILNFVFVIPLFYAGIIMLLSLTSNLATIEYVMAGGLGSFFLCGGLFYLAKGIRLFLLNVRFYQKGITVSAFKTIIITWEQIDTINLYYMRQTQRRMTYTFEGIHIKTGNGQRALINNIYNNFDRMLDILENQTSVRLAKELINDIRSGESVKLGDLKLNKLNISRKNLSKDKSIQINEIKSVKLQDYSDNYMNVGYFLDRGDHTGLLIPYYNQPNSFALKKMAEYFAKKNA